MITMLFWSVVGYLFVTFALKLASVYSMYKHEGAHKTVNIVGYCASMLVMYVGFFALGMFVVAPGLCFVFGSYALIPILLFFGVLWYYNDIMVPTFANRIIRPIREFWLPESKALSFGKAKIK